MELISKFKFAMVGTQLDDLVTNLQVTDISEYVDAGIDLADVDAVLTITSPDGDIIHENEDFDSPDIDMDVSRTFELPDLPENMDGYALFGDYLITERARIKNLPAVDVVVTNQNITGDIKITVQGEFDVDITQPLVWTNSPNGGSYTIDSFEFLAGNTVIHFTPVDPLTPNLNPNGTASFTYTDVIEKSFVANYETELMPLTIGVVANCDYATLLVSDNSVIEGTILSDVRVGTIKYPENLKVELDDAVFSTASYKMTDLYAGGTYNITLQRDIEIDTGDNTSVSMSLFAGKAVPVTCSDSLCCIIECYKKLQYKIDKASCQGRNSEASRLQEQLNSVNAAILLAQLLRSCSVAGYSEQVQIVKEILGQSGCDCGCDEGEGDGLAYRVTPITEVFGGGSSVVVQAGNGTVTVTSEVVGETTTYTVVANVTDGKNGATIFNGEGTPSSLLGNETDYYINTLNGDLYQKTTSGWGIVGNLQGAPGAPGAAGAAGNSVTFGVEAPDDGDGTDGDVYIWGTNLQVKYYKKAAGTWAIAYQTNNFTRNIQDNTVQYPLTANSLIQVPIYYIEGRDIHLKTTSGNTYVASFFTKKNEALTLEPFFPGEEVIVINGGQADITFEASPDNEGDGYATGVAYFMNVANADIVVPPRGVATFKYVPEIAGASSSLDTQNCMVLVSKNF